MNFLYLFIGLVLGFVICWLILKILANKKSEELQKQIAEIDSEKNVLLSNLNNAEQFNQSNSELIDNLRKRAEELSNQIATLTVEKRTSDEKLIEHKAEVEKLQEKFRIEFKNLANEILEEKTKKFTDQNKLNIGEILNPLKEKIKEFEKKIEDTYDKELRDTISLKEEVKQLFELNQKISTEANNLTKALKGDVKKQGNWGELVLEKILEKSGLIKGIEYDTQTTARNDSHELIRPDVIINLPDKKHLIIDSKVSLLAYDSFVNSDIQEDKEKFLKLHLESIKNHIKGLSEKNYQSATLFDTPDFVLMFIPIESSFSVAIQTDIELFNFAWDRKIVIVSPSTLLATLKTIESIWRHEKQTKNAIEIARQGGSLYDKFESFVKDLEKLGNQIETVNRTYDDAHKKLSSGKGNLIGQVEKLRTLGAKTSKTLPEKYLDNNI
ncbi:MAG: DNA recombination protein RmuC [Saprospiraceae bacterium]|nr:DNA recombination protein RmuC [Saprospiraceae bacterium]